MKTAVKILIGIGAVIFILVFIFSVSENNNPTGNVISEEEQDPIFQPSNNEPLQILSHEKDYGEYGFLTVTGIAKNTRNRELSYAQVDVKFYDNDGNVIGNSLDNINNLGAGETWKFKVMYLGTDSYNVGSYNISVGTTW